MNEVNAPLVAKLQAIKADHPFWGYRRIWAYLRYVDGLVVNKKRILRVLREHQLLVPAHRVVKACRPPRPKPRPMRPREWWGIDMTKVYVQHVGWMYVVVVLDWYTKQLVGHYVGSRCTAAHWQQALEGAVQAACPAGARGYGLHLMADNGCQPTATAFMRACDTLGIQLAYTSYNNPKGNADTERMIRTLKEELVWLHEWTSPQQLEAALATWIRQYNQTYLHSALGYRPPQWCEDDYVRQHGTLLLAA